MRKMILLIEVPHDTEGTTPPLPAITFGAPFMPLHCVATGILLSNATEEHLCCIQLRYCWGSSEPIPVPCGTWILDEKRFKQARPTSCTVHGAPPLSEKPQLFSNRDEEEHLQEICEGTDWRSSFVTTRLWCSSHQAEGASTRLNLCDTHKMISRDSCAHVSPPFYTKAEKQHWFIKGIFLKQCNMDKLVRLWKTQERCHLL